VGLSGEQPRNATDVSAIQVNRFIKQLLFSTNGSWAWAQLFLPSQNMTNDDFESRLLALRARIDTLDEQLVSLINQRVQIAAEIGRLKQGAEMPLHSPDRESEILQRIKALNQGPVDLQVLESLFRILLQSSSGTLPKPKNR
jgi:chorismate mutase-like protein